MGSTVSAYCILAARWALAANHLPLPIDYSDSPESLQVFLDMVPWAFFSVGVRVAQQLLGISRLQRTRLPTKILSVWRSRREPLSLRNLPSGTTVSCAGPAGG